MELQLPFRRCSEGSPAISSRISSCFCLFFVVWFRPSSVTSALPGCDVEVGHADARQRLIVAFFPVAETSSLPPNSLSFLLSFLSRPLLFCHVPRRQLPPPPPSFHSHARVAASTLIPFYDNADSDARCLSEPVSVWSRLTRDYSSGKCFL